MDALPANRTWLPSRIHGTYQHEAIISRSRQLLMMGTWLPETCWATIRREIKIEKMTSSWFSLSALIYVYKCHIYIILSLHLPLERTSVIKGVSIFSKKSESCIKILCAKRVTRKKFHIEDSQVLGCTVRNLVVRVTWHPELVHTCCNCLSHLSSVYVP